VRELAEPFAMSQAAISKHLKVLERAGLISHGRDAQRRPRKLEAAPLAEADEWLERYREFWEESYGRLDLLLDEMKRTAKPRTSGRRATSKRKGRGER
jgi:DNA-binding transcriptional ArsR family regulator